MFGHKQDESVAGRVVVITGGARGIGLATARHLSSHGASVAIADIDAELAQAVADETPHTEGFLVDVGDRASFANLLDTVQKRLGAVDVLINNAGVMALGPFLQTSEQIARQELEVNLMGVINGMQLAIPEMQRRGKGHVINVASVAGRFAVPGEGVYAASKHAVVGLSEVVRAELRGSPVEISLVLPGPVRTELASGMRRTRAIGVLSVNAVPTAILRTMQRPRFEVWVPRSMGVMHACGHLLPRALREPAQNLFGMGLIATRIDRAARVAYEERTFGA